MLELLNFCGSSRKHFVNPVVFSLVPQIPERWTVQMFGKALRVFGVSNDVVNTNSPSNCSLTQTAAKISTLEFK